MGKKYPRSKSASRSARSLGFALLFVAASAQAEDQKNLFLNTDTKNRSASDSSMQSSTTYAMSALMDLASFKIPSAVNNGMTAYGKYRNSETLDRLGDENLARAASMGSMSGDGSTASNVTVTKTKTTFSRLDPGFLRSGPAADVAAEFEKRSGMSREKFLKELGTISEQKISKKDPQMVDKAFSRFESFVSQIPNAEFRGNLQKAVNMVPTSARKGLIAKAVLKFANLMTASSDAAPGSDVSAPSSDAFTGAPGAGSGASAGASTVADAGAGADGGARGPASDDGTAGIGASLTEPAVAAGSDNHANPLGSVVQAAITSQNQDAGEKTIFQQVSRVYRGMAGFFRREKSLP